MSDTSAAQPVTGPKGAVATEACATTPALEPPLLVGITDMPGHEFYRALTPGLDPTDYDLPPLWEPSALKYPPICPQLELVGEPGARSYVIHDVPVIASGALVGPGGPEAARERWAGVRDVVRVESPEELAALTCYKVKPLLADGSFGKRTLLHPDNARTCEDMAGRLSIDREFEKFVYYTYACFVEPRVEEGIDSYAAFRDFYGSRIYAVEVERAGIPAGGGADATAGAALGLLWPDWICHEPDAHLEIGLLYRGAGRRYADFSGFSAGERCTIRVLAQGCLDLELTTTLHDEPPFEWSDGWYAKQLAKISPSPTA